jgi:2'-5' RNA ligase
MVSESATPQKPILYIAFPFEESEYRALEHGLDSSDYYIPEHTRKPPVGRHLTIAYLDEVKEAYVPVIIEAVEHYLGRIPHERMPRYFRFRFRNYELFPTPAKTYLVARAEAMADQPDAWSVFIRTLRASLRRMLAPKMDELIAPSVDDRVWNPHVTMGTVNGTVESVLGTRWRVPSPGIDWVPKTLAVYAKADRGSSGRIIKTFNI